MSMLHFQKIKSLAFKYYAQISILEMFSVHGCVHYVFHVLKRIMCKSTLVQQTRIYIARGNLYLIPLLSSLLLVLFSLFWLDEFLRVGTGITVVDDHKIESLG